MHNSKPHSVILMIRRMTTTGTKAKVEGPKVSTIVSVIAGGRRSSANKST